MPQCLLHRRLPGGHPSAHAAPPPTVRAPCQNRWQPARPWSKHPRCPRLHGRLTPAPALQAGQIDPDLDDGVIDKWNDAVEDVFWADGSDTFAAFSTRFAAVDLHFLLPNSVDSAISESVAGDIILIAIAVVVICTFVGVVFFIRDAVFTRTTLALLGCLCIALSIGAGFGLSFYLGVPFTSITQA